MDFQAFKLNINNGIARITLNQAERGNPFDEVFCREFNEIATECDENPGVRAIVIDANGRFFSVGGDLKSFVGGAPEDLSRLIKRTTADIHMAVSRFARMDAPVILICDALVTGGAVAIAAAADVVLSGPNTKFYAAFSKIGFSCDCGTSYFLPRRVGGRKAFSFLAFNETWTAEEALDYGLVSKILLSEELVETAITMAATLADGPTYSLGHFKRLILDGYVNSLESQLEIEARALAECARSQDTWQALLDVSNKKEPSFFCKC